MIYSIQRRKNGVGGGQEAQQKARTVRYRSHIDGSWDTTGIRFQVTIPCGYRLAVSNGISQGGTCGGMHAIDGYVVLSLVSELHRLPEGGHIDRKRFVAGAQSPQGTAEEAKSHPTAPRRDKDTRAI